MLKPLRIRTVQFHSARKRPGKPQQPAVCNPDLDATHSIVTPSQGLGGCVCVVAVSHLRLSSDARQGGSRAAISERDVDHLQDKPLAWIGTGDLPVLLSSHFRKRTKSDVHLVHQAGMLPSEVSDDKLAHPHGCSMRYYPGLDRYARLNYSLCMG
jgi:hypothetical protein